MKPKSSFAMMLGVGPKSKPDSGPPPMGGSGDSAAEPAADESSGMCSVMCPKCGETIPLEVKASDAGGQTEPDLGAETGGEAA